MAMLAAAAIAAGILPQRNGRRRAVNKQQYSWHTVAHQPRTCVEVVLCLPYHMVTILLILIHTLLTCAAVPRSAQSRR